MCLTYITYHSVELYIILHYIKVHVEDCYWMTRFVMTQKQNCNFTCFSSLAHVICFSVVAVDELPVEDEELARELFDCTLSKEMACYTTEPNVKYLLGNFKTPNYIHY